MFTIGAFAVILDKERGVLFCHRRDRDLWNLPGGKLETNEAPWEGVVREVKEEVLKCLHFLTRKISTIFP